MRMSRRMGLLGGGKVVASPILNENEWDVISAVSTAGEGENYWSVGDCKEIVLDGEMWDLTLSGVTVCAFIIGFNHNSIFEGENRIHFQLGKTALSGGTDIALCDSSRYDGLSTTTGGCFSMNYKNDDSGGQTNSGGWKNSQMRKKTCGISLDNYSGTIIAVIPAALRAVLKSVTKYTNNTGKSTTAGAVTATTDYFFLLSEYEVFGSISHSNTNESKKQAQYAYYSAGNSTIKYMNTDVGSRSRWWLRSPSVSGSVAFVLVEAYGNATETFANSSYGFAPGFCV